MRGLVVGACVAGLMTGSIAGCGGGGHAQLSIKVEAGASGAVKPGDSPTYKVIVTNTGPGDATGVNVHVDLPADFKYRSTVTAAGDAARTQPVDPEVHAASPEWGVWSMAAPRVNADGTRHESQLALTFIAEAKGTPSTYQLQARATGDNTDAGSTAPPLVVELASAPNIAMNLSVSPGNVHPNLEVTYTVAVQNKGTAPSASVGVLVTLPGVLVYSATAAISGNFTRNNAIDPIKATVEPFFGGFTIPPASDSGPGTLNISFRAKCMKTLAFGSFPVSAQLTDDQGTVLAVRDTSPVQVIP